MTAAVMAASFSTAYFRLVSLRMTCRSHDIVNMNRGLLPQILPATTSEPSAVVAHCAV